MTRINCDVQGCDNEARICLEDPPHDDPPGTLPTVTANVCAPCLRDYIASIRRGGITAR